LAQDTLYIDIRNAVSLAESNYSLQMLAKPDWSKNIKLPPTAVNFKYGQLYSPENGWQVDLNQDFGPVFQYNRQLNIEKSNYELEKSKYILSSRQYLLNVKSAYLQWIYYFSKLQIFETAQEYAEKYRYIAAIKTELGEIELLDQAKAETKISKIETEQLSCKYDIEISCNNLRKLLNTDKYFLPENKNLELYRIEKLSDTSQYSGEAIADIYFNEYKKSLAETKKLKAGYLPNVNAGIFYQDIGPYNNLIGIEAGIAIPIWYFPQKAQVQKQTIESENALIRYNQSVHNSKFDIENLISTLDKCFLKIRYYQNSALHESELTLNIAASKYTLEEISFEEYFEEVSQALQIRLEYLDCINNYNQTALQLELYSNNSYEK
jgi:heavy metal efflux system protein